MVLILHLQSNAAFAPDSIDFHGAAPVAQGIEQDGPNVKVGGSIPSGGTTRRFKTSWSDRVGLRGSS
jgi:hypothetical protein